MRLIFSIIFGLAVMFKVATVSAVPMVSVDMDRFAAGIQSSLTVDPGDTIFASIVYTGDGVAFFDAFAFDTVFNDMGAGVLGLAGGTGSPTAGSIAAIAPGFFPITLPGEAIDTFGGAVVVTGSALTPKAAGLFGPPPFPIPAPFTAGSDGLGMLSLVLPFGGGFPIGPGVTFDLFSLDLVALAPGMSTIMPSSADPLAGLFFLGFPVDFGLASGTVTVTPEPGTFLLMGVGLAGLAVWQRRRFKGRSAQLDKKSNT